MRNADTNRSLAGNFEPTLTSNERAVAHFEGWIFWGNVSCYRDYPIAEPYLTPAPL